ATGRSGEARRLRQCSGSHRSISTCGPSQLATPRAKARPRLRYAANGLPIKRLPYLRPSVAPAVLEAMKGVFVYQLALPTVLLLLLGFYGLTFLASTRIVQKKENVDSYMVSNNEVGFGMSAASMTATWIWAASFYAAASAGYKYGLSGALHYGFWGALMILFIYPFGKRFRQLAPKAHTLGEIMHARHGRSSQMILAGSNILGSCI